MYPNKCNHLQWLPTLPINLSNNLTFVHFSSIFLAFNLGKFIKIEHSRLATGCKCAKSVVLEKLLQSK